ncbi:DNA replication/repair protein RecF [Methylocapsa acidiphila]|uniref:DNA replication/repair protein RecF n=1 Tax=Methylocapsa acidiphila TaxID=133552 RepID=UPI000686E36A|nr:DNA replication/repair protein RecF [Methylocapsa acidiphila]
MERAPISAVPRGDGFRGVRRLTLADFRSYSALDLAISAPVVVLTGDNGAGKTNVIEALSLLTPGRGLRRADLSEFSRKMSSGGFAVSVELAAPLGEIQLGTGVERQDNAPPLRKYRIDREPVGSIRAFCDHLRVVWLTPSMDGLFTGSPGERRRFLDRLVLSVDADHGARVSAFERALRGRNRLLESGQSQSERSWLDAIEREIAELGVAVAAARVETVSLLSALIAATREGAAAFPWAEIALRGEVETLVAERPALEAEDLYREMLRDHRARDSAAGRALIGPQASDLCVRHGPKNIEAAQASTGEQKALLVGLVLAQAHLVERTSGLPPLVLLDEIAAHFDPTRRMALYDQFGSLGGQVWLTGADPATFTGLEMRAQMLRVTPGQIDPLA